MIQTLFVFLFSFVSIAEYKAPALDRPVIDQVGILSRSDRKALQDLLQDYNLKGKAQLQILIIPSLEGEAIEQASIRIVDQWKLGSAKADNGILFLIAINDRQMRIEVGQGLEGAIPDVMAKRILDDVVKPLFRGKMYTEGVAAGVYKILELVDKEYVESNHLENPVGESSSGLKEKIKFFLIILVLIFIFAMRVVAPMGVAGRRRRGYAGYGGLGGGGGWSSGGGSWSGGGGGFSGGGASSNW